MKWRGYLTWAVWLAALPACAGHPSGLESLVQARAKLTSDVRQCSQTYNYNPRTAVGIPENALAPNELRWHQCAHDAVRSYQQVNTPLAPLYQYLIDEDTSTTDAIMHGQMTRSERHARIAEILAKLKAAEQYQISQAQLQQAEKDQAMQGVIDMVRRLDDLSIVPGTIVPGTHL